MEANIQILEEKPINKGEFGEAYEVKVQVKGGAKGTFVLKKFFEQLSDGQRISGKDMAKKSFQNYTQAREAGLKVFPTFLLNEQDGTILMTIGYNEEWHCISNNKGTNSLENFGGEKLEEVPRFENFAHKLFEEAKKAADAEIFLPADSFFFTVSKNDQRLDFYVADVDTVKKVRISEGQNLLDMNLTEADSALTLFLKSNVKDEDTAFKYIDQVPKLKNKFIENIKTA
jgi:hypothetical protein